MRWIKNTGKEIWRSMDEEISYSSPILIQQAGKPVVVVWTAENLNGMDPKTGKVYWKIPFRLGMGMGIATPVLYKEYLFVSSFYSGSLLVSSARKPQLPKRSGCGPEKANGRPMHSIVSSIRRSSRMDSFTGLTVTERCDASDFRQETAYGKNFQPLKRIDGQISILSGMDNKRGCSMSMENYSLRSSHRKV